MNAAPLLVSFSSFKKFVEALPSPHRDKHLEELSALNDKKFPLAVSEPCIAVLFGYSIDFVYALSTKQHKFYRSFNIRQGKKTRIINSPRVALKVVQKWLGEHLSSALTFEEHVYGYVKGKSFVDAAKAHEGASWVYSIDISDFFPSISKELVSEALNSEGYSQESAELISELCTLHERLAQGSPASPVLSNLVMCEFDKKLVALAQKYKLKLSRYADDIVFSGTEDFVDSLHGEICEIFYASPFTLNNEKTYKADASTGQRLKVHGLLVKEDRVRLTKGYRNKIRAYKHMLKKGSLKPEDRARIIGHVKYEEFVNKKNG